jgi:hypothetical protein
MVGWWREAGREGRVRIDIIAKRTASSFYRNDIDTLPYDPSISQLPSRWRQLSGIAPGSVTTIISAPRQSSLVHTPYAELFVRSSRPRSRPAVEARCASMSRHRYAQIADLG